MYDTIRIGIIGAGANTRAMHIPKLRELPGVVIHSVCNRSLASGQAVADEFGIPNVAESWRDVVEDEEVDAVVIGTWPYMHCPLTLAAMTCDKHVLCEARMAMNSHEAHQMVEMSQLNPHLVVQVVPSPFTLPYDATIQHLLASGAIGDLLAIDVRAVGEFVNRAAPLNWRQDRTLSGNNIMAMGIWYEALTRWVGHATRVMAMGRTVVKTRPLATAGNAGDAQRLGVATVPDHLDIVAEMACGAQARFAFSSVCGLSPHGQNQVVLYGSEGTIHLDLDKAALRLGTRTSNALSDVAIAPERRGAWRVEAEFIGAIRGAEPVRLTTFDEGLRYMQFTDAVNLSLQRGEAIALPLL